MLQDQSANFKRRVKNKAINWGLQLLLRQSSFMRSVSSLLWCVHCALLSMLTEEMRINCIILDIKTTQNIVVQIIQKCRNKKTHEKYIKYVFFRALALAYPIHQSGYPTSTHRILHAKFAHK